MESTDCATHGKSTSARALPTKEEETEEEVVCRFHQCFLLLLPLLLRCHSAELAWLQVACLVRVRVVETWPHDRAAGRMGHGLLREQPTLHVPLLEPPPLLQECSRINCSGWGEA